MDSLFEVLALAMSVEETEPDYSAAKPPVGHFRRWFMINLGETMACLRFTMRVTHHDGTPIVGGSWGLYDEDDVRLASGDIHHDAVFGRLLAELEDRLAESHAADVKRAYTRFETCLKHAKGNLLGQAERRGKRKVKR